MLIFEPVINHTNSASLATPTHGVAQLANATTSTNHIAQGRVLHQCDLHVGVIVICQKHSDRTSESRRFDEFHTIPFYTPLAYYLIELYSSSSLGFAIRVSAGHKKQNPNVNLHSTVGVSLGKKRSYLASLLMLSVRSVKLL
jgi:hypothetical protein